MDARPNRKNSVNGSGADIISQELRRRIAGHEIPPGTQLKEQEIAQEFGVSRARIREVLAALELHGLVERVPNRGAVVRRLELSQVFEIYDVREVLEGLAVRKAVENEDPKVWIEYLNVYDEEFEGRVVAGEIELYESEFNLTRKKIIEAAANPVLAGMLDSVQDQTQIIMRRVLVLPGRVERGIRDLRAMLEAMTAGEAQQAEQLRRTGIRSAIADLKRFQRFVL